MGIDGLMWRRRRCDSGTVGIVSDQTGPLDVGTSQPGATGQLARARVGWASWAEVLGVALSPALAALVLRLRLMAPNRVPDPAMHTIFIVAPRDVFTRYAAFYGAINLRESARVGFLLPARLAYLAFGAVPGFFVTRYVFALVAVGPVYLLLRRLYGRPAGVAGILVVLSSPVIVTAWGTDYPDSAVVSYAIGAVACLAMPCAPRWRRAWLAAAGVLLVLAVWSHGAAVPLVGATLAGYVGVRLVRDRFGLPGDLVLLAGVAVAVTGLLAVASAVLIGHANFIDFTWQGFRYLSQPSQTARWHSANWRWALYVSYVLIPPAVLGAFAVAVARRGRAVPTPVLLVGVMVAVQVAVYFWLQFASTVELLEEHYFSATLWAGVCLAIAITVAELARPLWDRPLARWLPAAVLLAVPLGYEADPHVPPFGWMPLGAILAAAVIVAAAAARGCARLRRPLAAATATGLTLAAFAGAILVLTVAPIPNHPIVPDTTGDPAPAYSSALGGSSAAYIDAYRIAIALRQFVGPAAYRGEQLLIWRPLSNSGPLVEYAGMYHGWLNTLPSYPPHLTVIDRQKLKMRRAPELLLFNTSAAAFPRALRELGAFRPTLARAGELRAGRLVLHVWLIRLGTYYQPHHRR
jgi:4-amino-4-deoxy-L-arabinose transferase-like glycosyltransferase